MLYLVIEHTHKDLPVLNLGQTFSKMSSAEKLRINALVREAAEKATEEEIAVLRDAGAFDIKIIGPKKRIVGFTPEKDHAERWVVEADRKAGRNNEHKIINEITYPHWTIDEVEHLGAIEIDDLEITHYGITEHGIEAGGYRKG